MHVRGFGCADYLVNLNSMPDILFSRGFRPTYATPIHTTFGPVCTGARIWWGLAGTSGRTCGTVGGWQKDFVRSGVDQAGDRRRAVERSLFQGTRGTGGGVFLGLGGIGARVSGGTSVTGRCDLKLASGDTIWAFQACHGDYHREQLSSHEPAQ